MMSISLRGELLEDREHQLLLAHGAGVLDLELLGKGEQFGRSLGLEVLEFHFPHAGVSYGSDRRRSKNESTRAERQGREGSQVLGLQAGLKGLSPMRRPVRILGTGTRLHPPAFGGMA